MNSSYSDGRNPNEPGVCNQCGRALTNATGLCLQPQDDAQCICDDCYHDLLIPGPGDAHGSMS